MFFYDLRLAKYVSVVDTTISFTEELCCLRTTNGWVVRNSQLHAHVVLLHIFLNIDHKILLLVF